MKKGVPIFIALSAIKWYAINSTLFSAHANTTNVRFYIWANALHFRKLLPSPSYRSNEKRLISWAECCFANPFPTHILKRSKSMQNFSSSKNIMNTTFESRQLSKMAIEYSLIMIWCNFIIDWRNRWAECFFSYSSAIRSSHTLPFLVCANAHAHAHK